MLTGFGLQIKAHWKTHRPKMYAELEKTGHVDHAVYAAQELTSQAEIEAIQQGLTYDQARELYREEWAFLPSEDDVPELGRQPQDWTAPPNPDETTAPPTRTRSGTPLMLNNPPTT